MEGSEVSLGYGAGSSHAPGARMAPGAIATRLPEGGLLPLARDIGSAFRTIMRAEDDRTRTQRAALFAFLVRIVSAAIAYASQVVLARWMGSFEYGSFVFVWVWVLVLGGTSSVGLNIAAMRFVPEYREGRDWNRLRGYLRGSRVATVLFSSLVAGVALGLLHLFGDRMPPHYLMPGVLILFCLPIYTMTDVQDGIGRAHHWIGVGLVPPYVLRPLFILTGMVIAHAAGWPMQATTAAGCAGVATWLAGLIQTFLIEQRVARMVPRGPRTYEFATWLKTSLPILMILAFDLVVQNTDVLMISRYMTPSDVGIYFAGVKTIGLIAFVHYAVSSAVANQFAKLNARGDRDGLEDLVREAVRWTFWPSLVAAMIVLALGKPMLWLFGPEFTVAYGPMFVLAIGLLAKASMGPVEFLLNMLGEQLRSAAVLVFTAVLNVLLNYLLIPRFGLMGAAAATATSLTVASLLYRAIAKRRLNIEVSILAQWRRRPG